MWGEIAACKFRYEGDDKNPVRAHKQPQGRTKAATRAHRQPRAFHPMSLGLEAAGFDPGYNSL